MSKHHKMKQSVRYFLTMILCLCMLAGCGSRDTAQTLQTGNAAAEYHTEIVETDKNESTAEQTQADDTEKQIVRQTLSLQMYRIIPVILI